MTLSGLRAKIIGNEAACHLLAGVQMQGARGAVEAAPQMVHTAAKAGGSWKGAICLVDLAVSSSEGRVSGGRVGWY